MTLRRTQHVKLYSQTNLGVLQDMINKFISSEDLSLTIVKVSLQTVYNSVLEAVVYTAMIHYTIQIWITEIDVAVN
jgi:hypothetical protein